MTIGVPSVIFLRIIAVGLVIMLMIWNFRLISQEHPRRFSDEGVIRNRLKRGKVNVCM
jgi:hypothetical protein